MGLRDIERKIRSKSAYQRKEAELLLDELDRMIDDLEDLKAQLKKFEKEHKKEISTDRQYYEKLAKLRGELGLPREIGVYDWKESPTLKDRLTGKGYYDELGMEILELGKKLVTKTGGIISIAELILQLNKERPGKIVAATDVVKAIEKLVDAEVLQPLRKLKSGVLIAEFLAVELSSDHQDILDLAARQGKITREAVMVATNWSAERAGRVLDDLETQGIAIKEESMQEGVVYWFPSLG